MREIINLVWDRALSEHPDGRIDLVQDVGVYVPSMVIGDMLGVPREDADRLVDWTNRTTAFEDPRMVPDLGEVWRALEEFIPYVDAMIKERETNPTDDLTSAVIEAEIDGEKLSHEEVLMFFFLLMVAGNDSTRAVFTSGMKSLMEDPEQMELVRSGGVPLEQVVEEFVRFHPAFAYMRRTATRDAELAGQADRRRRQARALVRLGQPRRDGVRRPRRLRRPSRSEPPSGLRRRRPSLLPRRRPRPARAEALDRGDAAALLRHRARRADRADALHVPQPVEQHPGLRDRTLTPIAGGAVRRRPMLVRPWTCVTQRHERPARGPAAAPGDRSRSGRHRGDAAAEVGPRPVVGADGGDRFDLGPDVRDPRALGVGGDPVRLPARLGGEHRRLRPDPPVHRLPPQPALR